MILESLRFSAMNYRQEDICKPYQNTYKWVLKDTDHISHSPWSSLVQWLRSGNGVYWMNGKAGSGKSTLMRYVYENLVTRALLRSWAQGGELQLAAFFCWYSGSAEQRSKSGLLRSLLYDVLLQHRELIRTVFADEWMEQRSLCYSGSLNVTFTWHVKRLQRAFVQLAQSADGRMKMCFFVDGLDECDAADQDDLNEEHDSIAQLFKDISVSPNVKVCLSSRPWLVFEQIFSGFPGLHLQDLIRDDIRVFVFDKFNSSQKMQQLARIHPKLYEEFVTEIITKSDGVFLWVDLVVMSLLRGLQNQDEMPQLQERLRGLPTTLEKLFQHMLDRVDPIYLPEACRILLIYESASRHAPRVTPLDLDLATTVTHQEVLSRYEKPMEVPEIAFRVHRLSTKLKTHCLGLLEVHDNSGTLWEANGHDSINPDSSGHPVDQNDTQSAESNWQSDGVRLGTEWRVTYIHRSVANFLRLPRVMKSLRKEARKQAGFQSDLSVLMGYVTAIRRSVCIRYEGATSHERVWRTVEDALCRVADIDRSFDFRRTTILGELSNSAFRWLERACQRGPPAPETIFLNTGTMLEWENQFLSKAVVLGFTSYVKSRIESIGHLISGPDQRPLLLFALGIPGAEGEKSIGIPVEKRVNSPEMVKLLLKKGTNPNSIVRSLNRGEECSTIWQITLHVLHQSVRITQIHKAEVLHDWALILKSVLEHHADPRAKCRNCNEPRLLGSANFLSPSFGTCISSIIETLFECRAPAEAVMLRRVVEQQQSAERQPESLLFRPGDKRKFEDDSQGPQKKVKTWMDELG